MSRFIEMFGTPENNHNYYPVIKIGEMVESINYGTSKPATDNGKYVYLRMNNITYDGKLDLSEVKRINLSPKEDDSAFVHKGDLMFNRTNTKEFVGKTTVFNLDEQMVVAGYIIRVRFKEKYSPEYVSGYLNSTYGKALLRKMAKGAVHQANINAQEFQGIKVLDVPRQEQDKYVTIAKQADKSGFDGAKSRFIELFGTIDEPKVEVKKLIDLVLSSGQYGSNTSATDYQEGKPRYIRITDINDDGSLNDDIKTAEVIEDKYRLIPGDIVFARTGATVGKTYMHETGNAIYAGYLIKYQMNESKMKPAFMKAFTHSKTYYNWVANSQKVGAQPNISAAQYDNMPVLVPQIEKQEEFLAIYHQADKSGSYN